ncbi:helix-turn-helix domain-containing protein [Streptomyces zingiberis]|uniref:Helix-turn-helix domain-containing protein n=1 Tax=Streptomyces zingiberis TaxID=2053010 RepID=A0ABX1C4L5_9ACTN|nr:helix-turn-helix transcriptional regulator [Streptomyces zingiberis]NJQ01864.1 helix-turn-helix domain-containing protein [Streptomyces zingiberis]
MGNPGTPSPYQAADAAGFVAAMRRLKQHAGLTFRELEERAADNDDVLARSTLADTLRRTSLPRPEVVAAFVRACGAGQQVGAWLTVRDRIAAEEPAPLQAPGPEAEPEAAPGAEPEAARGKQPSRPAVTASRWRHVKLGVVAPAVALVALLAAFLVVWFLPTGDSGGSGGPGGSGDSGDQGPGARRPADGWVTIRPVRTPDHCLTDGRDRRGRHASAIAVQLPCAQAPVPRTYLEPAGSGFYRIQWHHPQEGKGCLTVITAEPAKGLVEPWDDCDRSTVFRLDPVPGAGPKAFRLHRANSADCIGIAGDETVSGAEATEEPCGTEEDQTFLIEPG